MIRLQKVTQVYGRGNKRVVALDKVSMSIAENSFTLVKGSSGCGKSTLLFTMGGMLRPSGGNIDLLGKNIYELGETERRKMVAHNIGFVFQSYYLLPYLSVKENIILQKKLSYIDVDENYMDEMIDKLQLHDRINHKPSQLSVGEKQRVAMLRSFVSHPKLILADEPTGNLDPGNAGIVMNFFQDFRSSGGTIVMVSHSSDADSFADQIIHLNKGMISSK
ncbi:MAG: ABC transporter ATP-binding protein [Bacteroidales bacterium]|nr:ABC transporter ATP-binding protein [Bacteroidales bacterium]